MDTMKYQVACSVEGKDFEVHFPDYDAAFQFYQAFQKATDNGKRCEIKEWVPHRGYFNAARLSTERTKADLLRQQGATELTTTEQLTPEDLQGIPRPTEEQ